jgi:hypothetical protein
VHLRKKTAIQKKFLPIFTSSMNFLLLLSAVSAHFEMLRPIPRIVGEMDEQVIAPCAGAFVPANRAPFLITNNSIELTFYWNGDNDIYFGFGENPDTFPYKVGILFGAKAGKTYTVPLDFSDVPGLANGKLGTIQAVCHQPKFDIYQCADVVLEGVPLATTTATTTTSTTTTTTTTSTSEIPKTTSATTTTTSSVEPTTTTTISAVVPTTNIQTSSITTAPIITTTERTSQSAPSSSPNGVTTTSTTTLSMTTAPSTATIQSNTSSVVSSALTTIHVTTAPPASAYSSNPTIYTTDQSVYVVATELPTVTANYAPDSDCSSATLPAHQTPAYSEVDHNTVPVAELPVLEEIAHETPGHSIPSNPLSPKQPEADSEYDQVTSSCVVQSVSSFLFMITFNLL